ncbi:MAG TPA: amidohydrolase family protein [Pseudomonadota bacterium]|nr:amidohydrolase family protein [Pseudomonadota bacterium]
MKCISQGASRREVLAMLSATAAFGSGAFAQAGRPRIIDTHHHIYPPKYVGPNLDRLIMDSGTLPAATYTSWTPQFALDEMEKAGIATALVSMTSPGVWFDDGDDPARARARVCNEFGAEMIKDHPGRFGMFAAIPLPDMDGSLREIEYALDTLKLDGIGLLTSYDGKLLGDAAFKTVFDELNRRKARVFVHPTMSCCGNVFPEVNGPTIEFPTDTARTITSLALTGTMARCPDVTFIFSHGGGTLPSIIQRIAGAAARLKPEERVKRLPQGLDYELKRQYYDLASIGSAPAGMAAVLKLWPITQLTYGSDVPFGSTVAIAEGITKLGLADTDLKLIQRGNAVRLFPRLA